MWGGSGAPPTLSKSHPELLLIGGRPGARGLRGPRLSYHGDTEQRFIPNEQKGEGKEKIEWACFLNGGFQKCGAGFHTETMARVHPAALSLLLSRPILPLCICP